MTTKYGAIDDIVRSKGSGARILRNPEYNIPSGMPPIDLEVRTRSARELYVVVDVRHDRNNVAGAMKSLMHVADQIRKSEYQGTVYLFVECLNASLNDLPDDARSVAYPVMRKRQPAAATPRT